MDSEMPYSLVRSLCIRHLMHHAVYCIILVLSRPFYAIPIIIIPFLIYEIFHLFVIIRISSLDKIFYLNILL